MNGMRAAQGLIRAAIPECDDYVLSGDTSAPHSNLDVGSRRVFLVHGHDNEMKETVARFLEQLGCEVIILHEQASGGDTIIEKVETELRRRLCRCAS